MVQLSLQRRHQSQHWQAVFLGFCLNTFQATTSLAKFVIKTVCKNRNKNFFTIIKTLFVVKTLLQIL